MRADRPYTAYALSLLLAAVVLANGAAALHLELLKKLVFFCGLTVVVGVWLLRPGNELRTIGLPPIVLLFLLSWGVTLIPLLWGRSTYDLPLFLATQCMLTLYLLVVVKSCTGRQRLRILVNTLVGLLVGVSVLAFLEAAGVLKPYGNQLSSRLISTLGNPLYLAGFLNLTLPFAYARTLQSTVAPEQPAPGRLPHPLHVLLSAAAAASGLVVLEMTGSRGAAGGALAGFLLFAFLAFSMVRGTGRRRAIRRWLALLGGGVAIAVAVSGAVNPVLFLRMAAMVKLDSLAPEVLLSDRIAAWQAATRIWLSQPPLSVIFGRGPESFFVLESSFFPGDYRLFSPLNTPVHAHNEYLEQLAEGGLLGLGLWLTMVGLSISYSIRTIRHALASMSHKLIAAAALAATVGALIENAVGVTLRTLVYQLTFVTILAVSYTNYRSACRSAEATVGAEKGSSRRRVLVVGLATLLCLASLSAGVRSFMSERHTLKGYQATSAHESLRDYDAAITWNPRNVYALSEKLWLVAVDRPAVALQLAGEIQGVIPRYGHTLWVKGMAQTIQGDYRGAQKSFSEYLRQDRLSSSASLYLLALQIMLLEADEATQTVQDLFWWQNRLLMKERANHLDLTERELVCSVDTPVNRVRDLGGTRIAELSVPYTRKVVAALEKHREEGFPALLAASYVAVGSLFDELEYGDVGLDYYAAAVNTHLLEPASLGKILDKEITYYAKAKALDSRPLLKRYLGYMLAIRKDDQWQREYDELSEEPAR